ncbi:MAG: hypothetical protein AB1611_20235 [bacterium]
MSIAHPMDTIVITGRGMVSSLGHDVVTGCAAARAGIVRAEQLDYPVRSPEDGEIENAIGHPVPLLTEGFEGPARLLRLVQAGLADLQKQAAGLPWLSFRVRCYLSLPNPLRPHTGIPLDMEEKDRQAQIEESQEAEKEPPNADLAQRILQEAARLSGWQGDLPLLQFVTTSGNPGVAEALGRAIEDLSQGKIDLALIGGIDSLLDEDTLAWLESRGRFKTPSTPSGLQPGEAGAFLLVETLQSARARGAHALAVVQKICLTQDAGTLLTGEPPLGAGLAEALIGLTESADWDKAQQTVWLITDQNGESYRAIEWGNALIRLRARSSVFANPLLWYPAASFGDTGAASGAVAICMATGAFVRNYAPAPKVIVTSSSEGPLRAAILLAAYSTK